MTSQQGLALLDSIIPAVLVGSLAILALLGSRELLKETFVAFKRRANA